METKEIIEKIKTGLQLCSTKYNVPARDIAIKIAVEGMFSSIVFYAMSANEVIKGSDGKGIKINVGELLRLNVIESGIVSGFLKSKLNSLAKDRNLDSKIVNARIFTKTLDFTPSVNLYEGEKVKEEITVEQLI